MSPSSLAAPDPGRRESEMADRPPRLRIVADDGAEGSARTGSRRSSPPNLYRPTYPCRAKDCRDCQAKPKPRTCRQKKEMRIWWWRFHIHGVLHRGSTGCSDKRSAQTKAAQIRVELEARSSGVVGAKRLRTRETLDDFAAFLGTGRGGDRHRDDEMRILREALGPWVNRYTDELGTTVYSDWLETRVGEDLRNSTKGDRVAVLRRFGKWLMGARLLSYDPFALLKKPSANTDPKRRRRRALKPEEVLALLRSTLARPLAVAEKLRVLRGVSEDEWVKLRRQGRVRALVYRLVCETGLRRSEVRRVRIKDVELAESKIWIPAVVAKAKREQYVVLNSRIRRRLAAYLRTLKGRDRETPLFEIGRTTTKKGKPKSRSAVPEKRTFEADLEAAGIPKFDERGRVVDFHALRKSFVTHLRMQGVRLDLAQRLARHSDIRLTDEIYTDEDMLPEMEAAEMLVPERLRRRAASSTAISDPADGAITKPRRPVRGS